MVQRTGRACGVNRIAPVTRRDVKVGRANNTECRAGRFGDRDNPDVPVHHRMRDPIRGGHYGERSCEPR